MSRKDFNIKGKLSNKGMTLIEVLVALVIITILIMGLLPLLGFSYTTIFSMSEKTKAITKAKDKTDEIYLLVEKYSDATDPALAGLSKQELKTELEQDLKNMDGYTSTYGNLFTYSDQQPLFYYDYKESGNDGYEVEGGEIGGYNVTIVSFYEKGKHHVKLDSFILYQSD